jgi:Ni2+-binding GTPase involved in maturation of urease and hydrogenase
MKRRTDLHPLADANRKMLQDAGVSTVDVVGPSRSGKSMLIEAALKRLPQFHTAVIYNIACPGC